MDENPPANAGDAVSIPGQAGSHMQESNLAQAPQLRTLCSRGWEQKRLKPACPEPGLCNKKPLQGSLGPPLPTLQLEKPRSKQPEPSAVKNQHMTVTSKSQSVPMLCTNVLEGLNNYCGATDSRTEHSNLKYKFPAYLHVDRALSCAF